MRLFGKIFNHNHIGAPEMKSGHVIMEAARAGSYSMFQWNRQVYAVPPANAEWDSLPIFIGDDLH